MPSAIQITGTDTLIRKLRAFQAALPAIMETATIEALELVKTNAQANLQFYFDQPRHEFEPEPTGRLQYDSWEMHVRGIGSDVAITLLNVHPAAAYIEFGTEAHEITPDSADKLTFQDPDIGLMRSEDRVYVSGIQETRFLSNAVLQAEQEIREIYSRHLMAAIKEMRI